MTVTIERAFGATASGAIRQVGWDVLVDGEWAQRFVTRREAVDAKFRIENGRSR